MNFFQMGDAVSYANNDNVTMIEHDNTLPNKALLKQTTSGQLYGLDEGEHHAWLGIPYAQAPVGALRWKAPRVLTSTATINTHQYGSICAQAKPVFDSFVLTDVIYTGSEDCLYLNVWCPAVAGTDPLPVMVWIHGGGNVFGDGNIEGGRLSAKEKVVVVSMNYRLGPLGWLTHSALRDNAESPEDASGNYGTLDIIQSLQWVQDNIAAFGGDPNRVTLFGVSAGAWNVFSLLNSPKAKGLFHRAIAQSGWPRSMSREKGENLIDDTTPGHPQSSGELILQLLQDDGAAENRAVAKKTEALMDPDQIDHYLRSKSYQEMNVALEKLAQRFAGTYAAKESVYETKLRNYFCRGNDHLPRANHSAPKLFNDGSVLSSMSFYDAVALGIFNNVPVIMGTTRDESTLFQVWDAEFVSLEGTSTWIKDPLRYKLANHYVSRLWKSAGADEPAAEIARQQANTFVYRFDWDALPVTDKGEDLKALLGATHAIDYPFVFGQEKTGFSEQTFTAADKTLSAAVMSYWAEFAYTGNPRQGRKGDLPKWQPWQNGDAGTD